MRNSTFASTVLTRVIKKQLAGVALLGLGATAAQASSSGYLVYCNNCNSSAITSSVLNSGAGVGVPVYVGDPVSGSYAAYQIYQDVDDSRKPPIHTRQVENDFGDTKILNAVHESLQFYAMTPVGWNKKWDVVYTGGDSNASAWTVSMFGSPSQTNFNGWLNTTGSGPKTASLILGGFSQALGIVTKANPALIPTVWTTVVFPDGSSIQGDHDNACGCMKADASTARDGSGNAIPYIDALGKIQNAGGVRKYPDTYQGNGDYQKYLNQIAHMPITLRTDDGDVLSGGTSGGTGGTLPWVCVEGMDAEGNKEITCSAG